LGTSEVTLHCAECLPSRTTSWERPERKSAIHDRVLLLTPEWWSFRRRHRWGTLSKAFGDRGQPANYRPISLTSILCKTLEHTLHSTIITHLEHHNLLSDLQHGFRKKRSTSLMEFVLHLMMLGI
jgi:hypothetical protein